MISEKIKEQAETIVNLHDGNSFEMLKKHISDKVFSMTDTWLTEDRYAEVCEHINKSVGSLVKMSFIDKLSQGEKILTLWKAHYSDSDMEVLWSICFDTAYSKVMGLHVEW